MKHLIASILERQGFKVRIECPGPDGSILDVFDETNGIIYEVQTKKQPKIEKEKVEKYTLWALVNDVIFIYAKDYDISSLFKMEAYLNLKYKLGA